MDREGKDQPTQRTGGGDELVLAISSGVSHLGQVLGGGIPREALVSIVGPPGSGKTTLANKMAFAAARTGRPHGEGRDMLDLAGASFGQDHADVIRSSRPAHEQC
ncbi:MAG: ATPase domain-containing protein [Ktedonobacterales bacterium]|jgi:RecA/RadA recombinase